MARSKTFSDEPTWTCGFCRDKGLTYDDFNGFRWCKCPAGVKRQAEEPQLVAESNAQRDRLHIGGVL